MLRKHAVTAISMWVHATEGTFRLVNPQSHKCIDITGGYHPERGLNENDGTNIELWTCHGGPAAPNQEWEWSNGALRNPQSGKCLDVKGGYHPEHGMDEHDGTNIQLFHCHGGANQQWEWSNVAWPYGQLRHPQSGKCLDITGGYNPEHGMDEHDGTNIQLWQCADGTGQQWEAISVAVPAVIRISGISGNSFKESLNGEYSLASETYHNSPLWQGHSSQGDVWLLKDRSHRWMLTNTADKDAERDSGYVMATTRGDESLPTDVSMWEETHPGGGWEASSSILVVGISGTSGDSFQGNLASTSNLVFSNNVMLVSLLAAGTLGFAVATVLRRQKQQANEASDSSTVNYKHMEA